MMRSWRYWSVSVGVGLALLATPSLSQAKPRAKVQSKLAVRIQAQIAAGLPPGLAVAGIRMPSRAPRSAAAVSVHWLLAPRVGHVTVRVEILSHRGKLKKLWVRADIRQLASVVVAVRKLKRGVAIVVGDLGHALRPVHRGQGWRTSLSVLTGSKVLRDVPAGLVIGASDVQRPAPIARGTRLRVVVRRGRLEVTAVGKLQYAVRPGQRAAVRLAGSRRIVHGRLISRNTVVVEGAKQ